MQNHSYSCDRHSNLKPSHNYSNPQLPNEIDDPYLVALPPPPDGGPPPQFFHDPMSGQYIRANNTNTYNRNPQQHWHQHDLRQNNNWNNMSNLKSSAEENRIYPNHMNHMLRQHNNGIYYQHHHQAPYSMRNPHQGRNDENARIEDDGSMFQNQTPQSKSSLNSDETLSSSSRAQNQTSLVSVNDIELLDRIESIPTIGNIAFDQIANDFTLISKIRLKATSLCRNHNSKHKSISSISSLTSEIVLMSEFLEKLRMNNYDCLDLFDREQEPSTTISLSSSLSNENSITSMVGELLLKKDIESEQSINVVKSLLYESLCSLLSTIQNIENNAIVLSAECLKKIVTQAKLTGPLAPITLIKSNPENKYLQEHCWRMIGDFLSSDSPPPTTSTSIIHKKRDQIHNQSEQIISTGISATMLNDINVLNRGNSNQASSNSSESSILNKKEVKVGLSVIKDNPTIAEELGNLGTCELLVKAMVKHSSIVAIQCWCCRCIYLLANDISENHIKLGQSGACEAVVQTLRNYPDQRDVQGYGCLAVAHLAWLPGNRERLLGMGCEATLETSSLAFQNDQDGLNDVILKAQSQLAGEPAMCILM